MCFVKSNVSSLSQNYCEVTFHISRLLLDTPFLSNFVMQLKRELGGFFIIKRTMKKKIIKVEKLVKFISMSIEYH